MIDFVHVYVRYKELLRSAGDLDKLPLWADCVFWGSAFCLNIIAGHLSRSGSGVLDNSCLRPNWQPDFIPELISNNAYCLVPAPHFEDHGPANWEPFQVQGE